MRRLGLETLAVSSGHKHLPLSATDGRLTVSSPSRPTSVLEAVQPRKFMACGGRTYALIIASFAPDRDPSCQAQVAQRHPPLLVQLVGPGTTLALLCPGSHLLPDLVIQDGPNRTALHCRPYIQISPSIIQSQQHGFRLGEASPLTPAVFPLP